MLRVVNLDSDLDWLFARQRFGMKPGLERMRAMLERLGQPQRSFRVVLVGGTNGKGSTSATLASILQTSGERVGLFTSPHLTRFTERFLVNGAELPEAGVLRVLREVRPLAEEVQATFFEVVTVMACLLFARQHVTTAVMEVGLGGRLDSTNALDPVLSVVTNVALDHTAILGETKELIAQEKAGILRPERPAVVGVAGGLIPIFRAEGANLWSAGVDFTLEIHPLGWRGSEVRVTLPNRSPFVFRTSLLGEHGARNAALAVVAALRLGVPLDAVERGVAAATSPGRMEVLPWPGGQMLLDGAHNPDGAAALAEALISLGVTPVPVIFGAAEDKDVAGVAAQLRRVASRVVLTRAALSPRAADPAALARYFPDCQVTVTPGPQAALDAVKHEAFSVACGSLYLIGELRPLLLNERVENRERWQ